MWHRHLIVLIERAAEAAGCAPSTMSLRCSGSGDLYARLVAGHDITGRRAERIVQRIAARWPADLEWPADIPRPAPRAGDEPGKAA